MNAINNVVMFSTADWNMPYLTNKQHMAKIFARNGFKVLYVESLGLRTPALSSRQDWRRAFKRLLTGLLLFRKAEKNIWICSPLQIPNQKQSNLIKHLNGFVLWATIRVCILLLGMEKFIFWSYHAYCKPVLSIKNIRHVIYHCVDDLSAVPGINSENYRLAEAEFAERCDAIFITHQNLNHLFENKTKVHYHSNVVDMEHFRSGLTHNRPTDLPDDNKPIIGFHGVLSDFKINFELLYQITKRCEDLNFVIIGEEREGQKNKILKDIAQLSNVFMLGHKHYDSIPKYLAHFDVALMPSIMNDYTNGMFPMKYYEYLAACLPVVTTAASFVNTLETPPKVGTTADEIITQIRLSLKEGRLSRSTSDRLISDNTWEHRFEKMMMIISKLS